MEGKREWELADRNGCRCVARNCPGEGRMFSLPKQLRVKWCQNLRIAPSSLKIRSRVCERHFGADSMGSKRLKGAQPMPTKFLGHNYPAPHKSQIERTKWKRRCIACGAFGKKFRHFPKETFYQKIWLDSLEITVPPFQRNLLICSEHFVGHNRCGKCIDPLDVPLRETIESDVLLELQKMAKEKEKVDDLEYMPEECNSNESNSIELDIRPEVESSCEQTAAESAVSSIRPGYAYDQLQLKIQTLVKEKANLGAKYLRLQSENQALQKQLKILVEKNGKGSGLMD